MRNLFAFLTLLGVSMHLVGCGGAQERSSDELDYSDDGDFEEQEQITLRNAEFTTEFDRDEMRATAPIATEFLSDTREIIFFGTLERLPRGAKIEVQWKDTSSERSIFASRDKGSSRLLGFYLRTDKSRTTAHII